MQRHSPSEPRARPLHVPSAAAAEQSKASSRDVDGRGLPVGYRLRADWEIAPRELERRLAEGEDPVLLDVRTPVEFEISRITGSLLVPLHLLPSRLVDLKGYAARSVVTICHHGVRSLQAASILRRAGFEDVRSLAGGLDTWSLAVDSTLPRY